MRIGVYVGMIGEKFMKKEQNLKYKKKISASLSSALPYEEAAARLFERPPDEAYIQEWTEVLKEPAADEIIETLSVLVFRLGKEWLALPTICFQEVAHRRPVHRIPHRSGNILQGLVNFNGKLELYIHLHALLQIEILNISHSNHILYQRNRMVAIIKEGELWVFPVDEVDRIYHWPLSAVEDVPATILKSTVNYVKGMMYMDDKIVGLLDEELLFSSLRLNFISSTSSDFTK